MTIVHVISSLGVGGMEQVVLRLAEAQQQNGHRVTVLALRPGPLEREAGKRKLAVRVLRGGRFRRAAQALGHYRAERPDIVHVHNPTSLHYGVLSKLVSRAPIVVTLHGDQDTHARLGTNLEWRMTDAAVVVSRAARASLQLPPAAGALAVVHNGISPVQRDGDCGKALRAQFSDGNTVIGVIVARIDGRKGHLTLLQSLRLLRDSGTRLLVLVVGDGDERARVEEKARELSLGPETVRFLGRREDVDQLLCAADFFVLPSDTEGLPMSVLEAMAHELPVVASGVGGIPELLESGKEGLLVPPGDTSALAAAMLAVAGDRPLRLRLGEAGRARATTEFSLAATTANYQRVYQRVRNSAA